MRWNRSWLAGVALSVVLAASSGVYADEIGYAVDGSENLYSVNLTTSIATLIGSTGQFLEGLAISPSGTLFGTSNTGNLYSIDQVTGAATLIGDTGLGNIEGLDFDGNTLLATGFDNPTGVYSLDTATAAPTLITSFGEGVTRAMTVQSPTTILAATDTPTFQSLVSVLLATGASAVLGTLPDFIAGMDIGTDGNLYALSISGNNYIIDQATGAGTLIGNTGGQVWLGLAIPGATAVPEPASLVLLGSGLLGLAFMRRRMKG